METARDEFLRRYATSPIHVPRLERFLAVYGDDDGSDSFCRRFIEWDRACPNAEAARIVTEVLSAGDGSGRIRRVSDEAVRGAIRWMSERSPFPIGERARTLGDALKVENEAAAAVLLGFLETGNALDEERFRVEAESLMRRLRSSSVDSAR